MTAVCHVIGPTNAGKTTFLEFAGKRPDVGLIEIGKVLRAKYPPEHFAGLSNPAHTAVEAWQIYLDTLAAHVAAGKRLVLADGQPRDVKQTQEILDHPSHRIFLHLWAPQLVRHARALARDAGNPEKIALSMKRLASDDQSCYEVVVRLECADEVVLHYDTSRPDFTWEALLGRVSVATGGR